MKTLKTLLLIVTLVVATAPVAFAQLGDCDNSSFSIQNLGTNQASVTVIFYDEAGTNEYTPADLGGGLTNPFPLDPGALQQIYVPGIPSLPNGRYSVVIESTEPIAVIANLIGYTGTCGPGNWPAFNGSYSGFDSGASTYYLPSVVYAFSNWNSLISIQNVTASPVNATITIKDPRGNPDRTASQTIQPFRSWHIDLETQGASLGLVSGLNGSAIVTATGGSVVVTDNQTAYGGGNGLTQSYNGFATGAKKFFAPALYNMFPQPGGWRSSINVQNIGTGPTNVHVEFSDGGANMSCSNNPLDPGESCLLYMPDRADGGKEFSGVIVSSAEDIVAIVNASNGNIKEAQTYTAIADGSGSATVGFPLTMKYFPGPTGGWDSNFLVQNLGTAACDYVTVSYSADPDSGAAGPTYDIPGPIAPGGYVSVYQPLDSHLSADWHSGSATVTCHNGQPLAGILNQTNHIQNKTNGDWSMSYNGINR